MAVYIERVKAIDRILKIPTKADDWYWAGFSRGLEAAVAIVGQLPAADVVEVVRCKDCIYFEPCEGGKDYCCLNDYGVVESDFCSSGERRGE